MIKDRLNKIGLESYYYENECWNLPIKPSRDKFDYFITTPESLSGSIVYLYLTPEAELIFEVREIIVNEKMEVFHEHA